MTIRKIILFCPFFILVLKSTGQNVCAFSSEYVNTVYCLSEYSNYNDNINASTVVEDILSKIKMNNSYFVTKVCKGINNAVAIKYNGIKYILLDVEWIEDLKYGKNDWFHLFVIGHEMGHHILKHTDFKSSTITESRKHELEADEFAGYILGLYGASKNEIEVLLTNFPNDNNPNSTHPQKKDRVIALKKGYSSTKNSLTSQLLQTLTKDADLNLSNLPFLISSARRNFSTYLQTNQNELLSSAIEYYQQAIRFSDDPQIIQELGEAFLANGNKSQYLKSLELAYNKSNLSNYLINILGNAVIYQNDLNNTIQKYLGIADKVDYRELNDIHTLIDFARYNVYLSTRNVLKDGVDELHVQKAIAILNYAIELISKNTVLKQTHYFSYGEIYNELGLCENRLDNNEKALSYFLKAKSLLEKGYSIGSTNQEEIYCYYSKNILTISCNLALVYVRLREWDKGLTEANYYETTFNNLSEKKKSYLINSAALNNQEIYYLMARCFHGLGQYEKAIKHYAIEINNSESKIRNGAVYYYRGLSFLGLNKKPEACADFKKGCDSGIEESCVRYQTTCK